MANTTNFNWETPDDTDLVKDGAAAIRTLGNSIDTSFVDLKGGTTGQILSKASNTDLDYTWIANDQGDITEVQAGTGISVASGTGPIPIVTNTVATAYDAKGDLVVGTGADTFSRLAVGGTNGHTLQVDSSTATGLKWAAPAGGGKVLQVVQGTTTTSTNITSTTYTDTTLTATITPSAATSKILVLVTQFGYVYQQAGKAGAGLKLLRGATEIFTNNNNESFFTYNINAANTVEALVYCAINYYDDPNSTSALTYKTQGRATSTANGGTVTFQNNSVPSSITLIEVGA